MTMPKTRVAAIAAMLGLVVATTPAIAGAAPERPADAVAVLAAAPAPAKTRGEQPANTERSRFVTVEQDALAGSAEGDRVSFEVFAGQSFTGEVDSVGRSGEATTWTGLLDEEAGSWTASRVGDTFHVSLQTDEGAFEVNKVAAATYRVTEASERNLTADDQVQPPAGGEVEEEAEVDARPSAPRDTAPDAEPPTAADVGNVVDVLVVTTAGARLEAGSPEALSAHVASGFAQANAALTASNVPYQLRMAGHIETPTVETGGNLSTDLRRLATPNDGYFDEAHLHREINHADLVSLWVGGTPDLTCGLGYVSPNAAYGFTALFRACATDNFTFAHEVGHNLGAEHDAGAAESPEGSAPYARGYVDLAARTRTVMAYNTACANAGFDCTRIGYFSNPAVSYNGRPTGTDLANNARAISEKFGFVAQFRQERIYGTAPTITGSPRFRGTLKIEAGAWLPAETALSYQWYADGEPMKGRTGRTLKVTKWMIGRTMTVLVTGSATHYGPLSLASAPTPPMGKALFRKRRAVVKGKARVGRVLKVKTKIRPKAKKVKYSWYRGNKRIKGAKKASYRLRRADRGKKVYAKIKARKKGYETLVKRTNKRKVR